MKNFIATAVKDSILAIEKLISVESLEFIDQAARLLSAVFHKGGKVLIAGNGGSLCDAMHFAEELTGQFRKKRRALAAMALSDPSHITCVGNDFGFEEIFARGVEAFGKPGDLFIGLSTSGNSPNIVKAFYKAKEVGLQSIAFLGRGGGVLKGVADLQLIIDGFTTSDRIQEAHMAAMHIIIEIMERYLFENKASLISHENPVVCC